MGLREWLVICGLVVVLLVILDSLRRHFGRNTLKFKLDRKLIDQFAKEEENPDILGPVRVRRVDQEPFVGTEGSLSANRDGEIFVDEPIQATLDAPGFSPEEESSDDTRSAADFEEILILYVESNSVEGFNGQDLLQCLLESGLRFGEMDIFHRHESMSGTGAKLFSMANALHPGVFDLDHMEQVSTRAVCFFMSLPGPSQPKQAFDLMLSAARKLASDLDGEVKDDTRSVLTAQTVDLYRQKISNFERKAKLANR